MKESQLTIKNLQYNSTDWERRTKTIMLQVETNGTTLESFEIYKYIRLTGEDAIIGKPGTITEMGVIRIKYSTTDGITRKQFNYYQDVFETTNLDDIRPTLSIEANMDLHVVDQAINSIFMAEIDYFIEDSQVIKK